MNNEPGVLITMWWLALPAFFVSKGEKMPPTEAPTALLTPAETVAFLRLDVDDDGQPVKDPFERLRNLHRYQSLPRIKRGRLIRYRLADLEKWLAKGARGVA